MVCVPCIVIPVLLYIWHRWIQPIALKIWNPWGKVNIRQLDFLGLLFTLFLLRSTQIRKGRGLALQQQGMGPWAPMGCPRVTLPRR